MQIIFKSKQKYLVTYMQGSPMDRPLGGGIGRGVNLGGGLAG